MRLSKGSKSGLVLGKAKSCGSRAADAITAAENRRTRVGIALYPGIEYQLACRTTAPYEVTAELPAGGFGTRF